MFSRRMVLGGVAAGIALPSHAQPRAHPRPDVITNRIALRGNRVWVDVSIGGRGPYRFIMDTGAVVSLIHERIAKDLSLRPIQPTRLVGVGGVEEFFVYEARDVVFGGGIRQASAVFAAPRREFRLGPDAAGLLAAGVLTSVDTDLDFEAGEWRVYPGGRGDRVGLRPLPSRIDRRGNRGGSAYIYVDAVLGSQKLRLLADTGMPGTLSLSPAATRRSRLWNDTTPFAPMQAYGIGGAAKRGRTVRAATLKIGDIAFDRPLVSLADPRADAMAGMDGIIGLALLERINLSTDIAGGRIWGARNGLPERQERYGLSGLWVDDMKDRLVVVEVSPGSPASEAGLRIGDTIHDIAFAAFIRRLGTGPGTTVPIAYRRNGAPATTRLTLREFL